MYIKTRLTFFLLLMLVGFTFIRTHATAMPGVSAKEAPKMSFVGDDACNDAWIAQHVEAVALKVGAGQFNPAAEMAYDMPRGIDAVESSEGYEVELGGKVPRTVAFETIETIETIEGIEGSLSSEAAERRPAKGLPMRMPQYVRVISSDDDSLCVELSDSLFNEIAAKVIFKVNRTELDLSNPVLSEMEAFLGEVAVSGEWHLAEIDLRGAASPEGPYDNNVRLARERAETLKRFLAGSLNDEAVEEIVIKTTPEDYGYLLWLLERDGDSAAIWLRRFIDRYGLDNPHAIKRELQQLYDGRYWSRLLTDYFPKVRAARVVLTLRRNAPRMIGNVEPPTFTPELCPVTVATPPMLMFAPQIAERRHMLSLSTNLLYDGFYMPQYGWAPMVNVGAEFFPKAGKWSFAARFTFPYYHRWNKHKFFQIRDYHLEVRRWINPGMLNTGLYVGAYVNANKYGIGLSAKKGWQGEGWGGALKVGYVIPLGSGRWRLDFHAAVGGYITRYDPYVYGNPVTGEIDDDYYYDWTGSAQDFHRRNHRFRWFGPTEVGVTISFDVLYWRIARKGASFVRREVITW